MSQNSPLSRPSYQCVVYRPCPKHQIYGQKSKFICRLETRLKYEILKREIPPAARPPTVCPGPASPHPHSKIGKQSFLPFQRKTRCVVRLSFPVLCGSLYSLQVKYLQSNSSVCRGRSCHWCPLNTSAPPRPAPPESARLLSLFLSRYDPGHC